MGLSKACTSHTLPSKLCSPHALPTILDRASTGSAEATGAHESTGLAVVTGAPLSPADPRRCWQLGKLDVDRRMSCSMMVLGAQGVSKVAVANVARCGFAERDRLDGNAGIMVTV